MNAHEFEHFIHQHIPITKAMEFSIIEFTPSKVKISAKLKPNTNHQSTAFGGSINSLMTVCGWAMVFNNMKEIDPNAHIVVKKSSINYYAPIKEDFIAQCDLSDQEIKRQFLEMYTRNNKASLVLDVSCSNQDSLFAQYQGQYIVFK